MPEHRIRVVMRDTGGGFGQKVMVQRDEMCLMLAAPKVGAPVKWVEDRRENLLAAGKSRHEHAHGQDGVRRRRRDPGRVHRLRLRLRRVPHAVADRARGRGRDAVPRARTACRARASRRKTVYTNTVGRTAYRGPWQFETLAREVLLDIAAREMGIDPVELRRRNVLRRDELPYTNPNGMPYDNISPRETLEQALAMLDYDAFRTEQAEARAAGRYLGVGVSNYVEPSTPGFGYYATEAATIRIEPSGAINVYIAGGSTGNSIETTVVQLTADALGANIEDVNTIQGDTAVTGFGAGAAGSRSGSMTAGAIRETATILRERIAAIAAHKLEAAVDDIELADSRAIVRGTPVDRHLARARSPTLAYFEPFSLPPGVPAGLEASARYTAEAPIIWVNATHVCTCEVDVDDRRRHAPALHRERGLRPDDQPERRRGPDRGRRRAGHRRRAVRSTSRTTTTATRSRRRSWTTSCRPRPRCRCIEYGHIETPSPGPGRLQGRRRRRRDRRAARRRQRGRRRALAVRRDA